MSFIHINKPRTLANIFDDLDLSDESVGENTECSEASVSTRTTLVEQETWNFHFTEEVSVGRENTKQHCNCVACERGKYQICEHVVFKRRSADVLKSL